MQRWAWLLVIATAACSVVEVAVMRVAGVELWSAAAFRNAFPIVNLGTVVGALVGAVILSRHPRHRIGWLFCWGQLGVALGLLMRAVADATGADSPDAPPSAAKLADLLANLLGSQFALALLAVLLLLAPEGQLLSTRWRWWLAALGGAYLVIAAGLVLIFWQGLGPSAVIIVSGGQLAALAGLLASVAALLIRLRRSAGETRQQLRWIAYAAAVLAAAPVLATGYNLAGSQLTPLWVLAVLHIGYLGIPIATGFAVLRYRLYDVDRLMGGSVVLAVLAVLSAGGYIVVVGLVGSAISGRYPWWLSLVVFVAAVLAFQPVRGLVRRLADRLVYGEQSMSYEALSRFTRELVSVTAGAPFLAQAAEAAGRLVNGRRCVAVVVHPDGSEQSARWPTGDSDLESLGATEPDADAEPAWVVPVRHQGGVVGRFELDLPDFATGTNRRHQLLDSFAEQVSEGFVHARLERALRRHAEDLALLNQSLDDSRQRLLAARDIGRRRVADRIGAEVVDRLVPVAEAVTQVAECATDVRLAAGVVDEALESTTRAIEQLRKITSTVFSRRLAEEGLAAALRAELHGPELDVVVRGDQRWPPAMEAWLFACCTELLRGVRGQAIVELAAPDDSVAELVVQAPEAPDPAVWSASSREWAEVLGGSVRADPGQVVLRLPLLTSTG